MKLSPRSRLVMIGDSVTDCDRARPVGDGEPEALGHGYVAEIAALLMTVYPARSVQVTNMGIGGNTVRDLVARWDADVLALKPDWLSICIGINDVWRQFDLPRMRETHVGLAEYERTCDALLQQTRPHLEGLVLLTPYFIEPNRKDQMRRRMDAYGAVVKRLARKHDAALVDLQAAFDRVLRHQHPMALAWDRIHPNQTGHMVIARAFLSALGFKW